MVVYDQMIRWDNGYREIKPEQREQLSLPDVIGKELLLKIYTRTHEGLGVFCLEYNRRETLGDTDLRMPLPLGFLAEFENIDQAYTKTHSVENLMAGVDVYQIGDIGKVRNCDGSKLDISDDGRAYIFVPKLINSDGDGLPVIVGTTIDYNDDIGMIGRLKDSLNVEVTLVGLPTEKTKYRLIRNWDPW